MKAVADSKGRLTAIQYFKPGKAFDISQQEDGSVRVIELAEREVPTARVKFNADGSFECPSLMSRQQISEAIRADRDAQ